MRLSRSKPASTLTFNMTPMIDIVFLLIIFFMTVSQITRTIDTPMPLPRVTSGDEQAKMTSLTINLDQDGNIIISGKLLSVSKSLAAIKTKLEASNNDPSKVKIQIRCHRECPSRHVSELFQNLSKLGFTNVRSAVSDL